MYYNFKQCKNKFFFASAPHSKSLTIVRWCVKEIAVHVNSKKCKLICTHIYFSLILQIDVRPNFGKLI